MLLRYFCKTILTVPPDSFYDLKWPIYSGFLIGECTFSTISSETSGIFNFFKDMSLRYFFQMIIVVVQYKSYNLKSPPYAPVVYVKNIKICIHSQGVRISSFSNISTFEAILLVLIIFMLRFKMGTVSDLSLKSLDIQRPGGIMCDHLFISKGSWNIFIF